MQNGGLPARDDRTARQTPARRAAVTKDSTMNDGRTDGALAARGLRARDVRARVASRLRAAASSRRIGAVAFAFAVLGGCGVPNNPNPPGSEATNTYFTATQESSPKYLDPTSSYASNETPITYAVYEPPLAYHYLKRPYQLIPRLAEEIPVPRYLDRDGHELPADAPGQTVAESVYDIHIRRGVLFAPHPAFAKNPDGSFVYANLKASDVAGKFALTDFPRTGTRELVADDFVYAIKRMATPRIKSSSFSVMNEYIVGMKDYAKKVRAVDAEMRRGLPETQRDLPFLDFRKIPFDGAQRGRRPHAAHPRRRQVSAVQVLARDDVLRAGAVGGRGVLRAARHGRAQPDAELLAGRHRSVHGRSSTPRTVSTRWCATRTIAARRIRAKARRATRRRAC